MSFLGALDTWPALFLLQLEAWHLAVAALMGSWLLVSPWPLLSMKFESGAPRVNAARWVLLGVGSVAVMAGGLAGLFFVMLFYFPYSFFIARYL